MQVLPVSTDFTRTNGCYLYQGRDVKEDKDRCLKDQILVIASHCHLAEMPEEANDE